MKRFESLILLNTMLGVVAFFGFGAVSVSAQEYPSYLHGNEAYETYTILLIYLEGAGGAVIMLASLIVSLVCFVYAVFWKSKKKLLLVSGWILLGLAVGLFILRSGVHHSCYGSHDYDLLEL